MPALKTLTLSSELVALTLNLSAMSVAAYLPLRYFGPRVFPRRAARRGVVPAPAGSTASSAHVALPGAAVAGAAGAGAAAGMLGNGHGGHGHGWSGSVVKLLRFARRGGGGGGSW